MSITAQGASFGLGLNVNGVKGSPPTLWHRYKVLAVGLAPNVPGAVSPPEISGSNNPSGAYKLNTWFGGRVTMQPRLEDDFGQILLAATGECTTTADTPEVGVNQHVFHQLTGNAIFIPFLGVRRMIPAPVVTDRLGEIGDDCVIPAITFNFPQTGPISCDVDFVGLNWQLDDEPELWTWNDIPEDYDTVPMVMKGTGITLPNWTPGGGLPLTATSARITILNNTTAPQEEFILGSYFPEDYATRQRTMIVEYTYKWKDDQLYRLLVNGNATGALENLFDPCITFTNLDFSVEAPCDIPGQTTSEILRFQAPKMFWQMGGPVPLAGDDLIMMSVVGQALEAVTGLPEDYYTITLNNTATGYTIPTS